MEAHEPLDFRATGPLAPLPIAIDKDRRRGVGYTMKYANAVKKDEALLTHDTQVLRVLRTDGSRRDSLKALMDPPSKPSKFGRLIPGHQRKPVVRHLSLKSHGLPLECPGLADGGHHYFEGVGEMLNHSPNATTTVCAEHFEVDVPNRRVLRYTIQICATRDMPHGGWEMTADYGEWTPTGALNRGRPNGPQWIRDMLGRSADVEVDDYGKPRQGRSGLGARFLLGRRRRR